jgi:hypothetical protein
MKFNNEQGHISLIVAAALAVVVLGAGAYAVQTQRSAVKESVATVSPTSPPRTADSSAVKKTLVDFYTAYNNIYADNMKNHATAATAVDPIKTIATNPHVTKNLRSYVAGAQMAMEPVLCEQSNSDGPFTADTIKITGDKASAIVHQEWAGPPVYSSEIGVKLVREADDWKIDAIVCVPSSAQ